MYGLTHVNVTHKHIIVQLSVDMRGGISGRVDDDEIARDMLETALSRILPVGASHSPSL